MRPALTYESSVEWRLYCSGAAEPSAEALHAALEASLAHVSPFLAGHIWQQDAFTLDVQPARCGEPSCLAGGARFGDCVEDEWLCAWLVFELTRALPQLVGRVWDGDGEFLLIEAAYALPRWARKPEDTLHRVFVKGGELRLLQRSAGDAAAFSLLDGLAAVHGDSSGAMAPPAVRARLSAPLGGFPARCAAQRHVARVRVPARVALLLQEEPQLVAPAVAAFYERDPRAVRDAAACRVFPHAELVLVPCAFSRVLFAQLHQQSWAPPKSAPPLPPATDPLRAAAELGGKLTAGFEMLAAGWARSGERLPSLADADSSQPNDTQHSAESVEAPLPGDGGWDSFLARITSAGFFADAGMPGGAAHTKRLTAARTAYIQTQAHRRFVDSQRAPARRAAAIIASRPSPLASDFPPCPGPEVESSTAWMEEGEALLDRALGEREAERLSAQTRRGPSDEAGAARAAAEGVRAFVAARGGSEGAELPPTAESGGVNLEPASFLRELSRALGLGEAEGLSERLRALGAGSDAENDSIDSDDLDDDFDEQTASESEGDEEMPAAPTGDAWQRFAAAAAAAESDSDDESGSSGGEGGCFRRAYGSAMAEQLRGTEMAGDFSREGEGEGGGGEALPPIDLDLNLVQGLLRSYAAQEGLPGPASNLLGALGLSLPHVEA